MSSLEGQIAVVTGASSGIGKACSYALARAGVTVCLLGRNFNELKVIENEIKKYAPLSELYEVDLFQDDEVARVVASIKNKFQKIQILVHSAGIYSAGSVLESSVIELDKQYKINIRAPYLLTQMLMPIIDNNLGQIGFVNSTVATSAKANLSHYCSTKAALKAFADSLRAEINSEGIRVLTIYPGRTATPMQEDVCRHEGVAYNTEVMIQPDQVADILLSSFEMSRDAEITDITMRPMNAI